MPPISLERKPPVSIDFIDNSPRAYICLNENAICLYANQAARQLLFSQGDQLKNLSLVSSDEYIYKTGWKSFLESIKYNNLRYTTTYKRSDGAAIALDVGVQLCELSGEKLIWLSLYDISDWDKREKLLLQRERQFRAFFENSMTDINLKDKDGRYIMVNREFERNFDLECGAAEGKLPGDIFPTDFAKHVRQQDIEVMESGKISIQEDTVPKGYGDKEENTLLVSKFPIYGPNNTLEGLGVVGTDITYLKKIEARLRASEERFMDFANAAADFFWEINSEFKISFVSSGFYDLTGLPENSVLNLDIKTFAYRYIENYQQLHTHYTEIKNGMGFENVLYHIQHPQKGLRILKSNGKPLYDETSKIIGFRGAGCDVTEAQNLSDKLAYEAKYDHLTNLLNRRGFESILQQFFLGKRHTDSNKILLYLDLDQFKVVNDTCGHPAGDALLKQTTLTLRGAIREYDVAARMGGDEFAVVLQNCTLNAAVKLANHVRAHIAEQKFFWEGRLFKVTASIGIATIDDSEDMTQLLSAADAACYAAKDQGKNRVYVYSKSDDMLRLRYREMHSLSYINKALDDDSFILRYQPIVSTSGTADAVSIGEILVHLRDPKGKEISADKIMQAAERYGVVTQIDRWVIGRVFSLLDTNKIALSSQDIIAINISAASLGSEGFVEFIESSLSKANFLSSCICFELTETAVVSKLSIARDFMLRLKRLECKFALDDFGSGMSSFSYLKNLPVDIVKIDGQFIRNLAQNPVDSAIVEAITTVAHKLKLKVVAEHVEDIALQTPLREIGVDYIQGYAIARPFVL